MADPTLPETPTDEAIEAMAKATCSYHCGPSDLNGCCSQPMGQKLCQVDARAAYAALRRHLMEHSNG